MKRLFPILLCGLASLLFGCNTTPDPVLTVTPENLAFSAEGGAQTVQVKANNPWTASASGSGISVNPSSGEGDATVTVTATATSSTNPVSGTVVFRSEGLSATVSVTQDERKVIQVGDVMVIPAEGGTFAVDIQYNTDFDVVVESGAQSWITFVATRALQSGKLEFRFAENQNTDPRQGKVTVKDKSGKVSDITLTFVQEEKKVITVGDVMTIPAEGGTFAVDIQYNTDFDVVVESGAQSWITFVATRALKSGQLEFQFAENQSTDPRQGKVTVKDKSGKVSDITLTFVQEEKKVITVGDVMTIPAEGGTFMVDIQYNTDFDVAVESGAQHWITFVATRALQSGKLEFRFAENPDPDTRQGRVTVKDKSGKVPVITLNFVQEEKKVIDVGDGMKIPAEGGTFTYSIQYNTDFDVVVESGAQSWIHFVAVRSLTSGYLEFSFEANPNPEERTGKVTVKDKSGKVPDITITFVQEEKKVIQVGEVMTIPPEGGTFTVDIQYNTDYKVQVFCEGDWMTYVQTRSLIDGKLEFYFKENKGDRRECYAYVFSTEGGIETIELCFKQETSVRDKLMRFFYAMDGPNWKNKTGWGTDAPVWQWEGVGNPDPETGLMSLYFRNNGLKGEIPDFIDEMNLWRFVIDEPGITGTLPASFGNLVNLESLEISNTAMTSLPDIFGKMKKLRNVIIFSNRDMTGPLPESLGASDELVTLGIDWNGFTGTPPDSWARHYDFLSLWSNKLSGEIPLSFRTGPHAGKLLQAILMQQEGYGFVISDMDVPGNWIPDQIQDIGGKLFTIDDVIKKNKYTVYLYWAPWCPFSKALMPQLLDYYKKYRQDGLEIIATVCVDENGETWRDKARQKQVIEDEGYNLWYNYYFEDYQPTAYPATTPQAEVFDSKGNTLFSHLNYPVTDSRNRFGHPASTDLIPFLETLLGPAVTPDPYSSSDYSKDGEVITLQQATTGKGIDIVFLGDAYTDRDMASGGLYETVMRQAMEEFFAIEPYKTFRNRFNVYAVKAVSKNGMIGDGYTTAFGTYFGKGTEVNGNTVKAFEYALNVPGISSKENILVNIIVNTQRHAGTAVMSESLQSSVAFTSSMGNDPKFFGNILRHEGGGHGFAFLADEYSTNQAMVPQGTIDGYNSLYNQYGWYANVDFTSDPTKIKWSAFLSDSRYDDEVGIYEGGALYSLGVYRPSKNSMMRENFEYYNAPSRWAIYQQIMKRSGESCSFEKFLEYDAVNRAAVSEAAAIRPPLKAAANGRSFEHTAPPVVIP